MLDPMTSNDRRVGRVLAVSNVRVTVLLDKEPKSQVRTVVHRLAWVTQLGGFLIFEVGPGNATVGIIIGASEDDTLERETSDGFSLQLALARRILRVNLVGQLHGGHFAPGVSVYPTLDTPALIPSVEELQHILTRRPPSDDLDAVLNVGRAPLYPGHEVGISYNDIFSRPVGIIGNTGAGKSCSVASFLQEGVLNTDRDNAKVVLLDVNGEYGKVFGDKEPPERRPNAAYVNGEELKLPIWLCNLNELAALFEAATFSQFPVLERVVSGIREDATGGEGKDPLRRAVRYLDLCTTLLEDVRSAFVEPEATWGGKTAKSLLSGVASTLDLVEDVFDEVDVDIELPDDRDWLTESQSSIENHSIPIDVVRKGQEVIPRLISDLEVLRGKAVSRSGLQFLTADAPVPYSADELRNDHHFDLAVSRFRGQQRMHEYIATLRLRIHRILSDRRWEVFWSYRDEEAEEYMERLLGGDQITVIDCSMLAFDVLPFFCAVIARTLLDLRTHGDPADRTKQPWILVLEEAHNYLRDGGQDDSSALRLSREAFERVAKEGRKYGLSMIIASQRPSDVSATVLSQCANFIVHRIQNPEDIDYFRRILPIGSRELLDQLPILAPGEALAVGSAVNVPSRVTVRLPEPKPESSTTSPWEAWAKDAEPFGWRNAGKRWFGAEVKEKGMAQDGDAEEGS